MDPRRLQADPELFRRSIKIDVNGEAVRLGDVVDDWQEEDFRALDPAWRRVAGQRVEGDVRQRAYLERARGHAKTNDIAVMVAWALFASRQKIKGICGAADGDQAALLKNAVDTLCRLNPWLGKFLKVQAKRIVNESTGSELEIIPSDAASSYGLTPDFVVCDELTHWTKPALWTSLFSAAAKRERCLLLVISNAGFRDSWQWDIREQARLDDSWYFRRLDGPQASWIGADKLAEQERMLPAIAYRRLWLNEWTDGAGDAIEPALIQAAVTLDGPPEPEPGWVYVAGLDIGLSRDASALVVLRKHVGWTERKEVARPTVNRIQKHLIELGYVRNTQRRTEAVYHNGTGRLQLVDLRIWKPAAGKVELEQVENAILEIDRQNRLAVVAFDPWQCEYMAERLQKQHIPTNAVNFVGRNLQGMATATLSAFRERQIDLFENDDLLADLKALRVVEKSYGFRLESPQNTDEGRGTRHGDAATALSLGIYESRKYNAATAGRLNRPLVLWPDPAAVA